MVLKEAATGVGSRERFSLSLPLGPTSVIWTSRFCVDESSAIFTSSRSSPGGGGGVPCGGSMTIESDGKERELLV